MKIIKTTLAVLSFACVCVDAAPVNLDGFGRYAISDFTTSPSFVSGSWGPGTGTLGFSPDGGNDSWNQFFQFDITGNETEFNNATSFTLDLDGILNGGRRYDLYVAAGSEDIMSYPGGANAINNVGIALGGTEFVSDTTTGGTFSITGNSTLDSFLSGVDFTTNQYIYLTFRPDQAGGAGGVFTPSSSSISAIPEPSSLVLIGIALAGLAVLRRRK